MSHPACIADFYQLFNHTPQKYALNTYRTETSKLSLLNTWRGGKWVAPVLMDDMNMRGMNN